MTRLATLMLALALPCALAACPPADSCADGEEEVSGPSECLQDDATCYELSAGVWCTGPDAPECPAGYHSVEGCDLEDSSCYQHSEGLMCEEDQDQCLAMPICGPDETEVDSESECLQDDAVCYENEMCGVTIWCTGPADVSCEAYPECAAGETEVGGATECLQDDAVCYENTVCGATIWCTGPDA